MARTQSISSWSRPLLATIWGQDDVLRDLPARTGRAVVHYWATRTAQRDRQKRTGKANQGLRSAVTGGAQKTPFRKTGAAGFVYTLYEEGKR